MDLGCPKGQPCAWEASVGCSGLQGGGVRQAHVGGFPLCAGESFPPWGTSACKCRQLLLRHGGAGPGAKGRVDSPALNGQLMAKSEQNN